MTRTRLACCLVVMASSGLRASDIAGRMLRFDGIDDFVRVPDSPSLDFSLGLTIEMWVSFDSLTTRQRLLEKGDGGSCNSDRSYEVEYRPEPFPHIALDIFSGGPTCDGWTEVGAPFNAQPGEWIHIAATYDSVAGQALLYLNGQQAGVTTVTTTNVTISMPIHASGQPITIGGNPTFGIWFKGEMDEVRLWRIARSAADIARTHNQRVSPTSDFLHAYWKFDEALTDQSVLDSSLTNHGTLGQVSQLGADDPTRLTSSAPLICYANCDATFTSQGGQTFTPNDFLCFLNSYANGNPYANCDDSSGTPTLTPNDFLCFLNAFATGCS
jgi:hypothetical protein